MYFLKVHIFIYTELDHVLVSSELMTESDFVGHDLVHHLIIKNTVQEDYFWNLTIQNLLE